MIDAQSIEQEKTQSGESRPKRLAGKQIKFIVGGIIIAAVVAYMIVSAAQGSAAYYMTIEEIKAQGPSPRNVRVAGFVVGKSIVWEPRDLQLAFDVTDDSGTLSVSYNGSRPDMFKDGAETVLEGKYTSQGIFEAKTMILKCPSKYQEAAQDKEMQ
ncbi:MAG: cytochrome c maturation protein CcmE [Anaerolineae bacterium]|nr:cytochrome c maturation protein CcmE [Anaerolineae bacterium]